MKGQAPQEAALWDRATGNRLRLSRDARSPRHRPPARYVMPLLVTAALVGWAGNAATGAGGTGNLTPAAASQHQRFAQALSLDVADVSGVPGQTIPFVIAVQGEGASNGFIMIRGMPEPVKLSSGFPAGDSWMVALKDIGALEMVVPDGYEGRFNLEVILVVRGSGKRDSRIVAVNIAEPGSNRGLLSDLRPTNAIATPPADDRPAAPRVPAISATLEKTLLDRATQLLQKGDISAARLAYEHLANSGSALGALSLAKTFDPDVLSSLGVVGMRGDPAEAKRWYEKAAELGSEPATARLRDLARR